VPAHQETSDREGSEFCQTDAAKAIQEAYACFTKMQLPLAAVEIIPASPEKAAAVHDSLMHHS
jgi:hypothetical protein